MKTTKKIAGYSLLEVMLAVSVAIILAGLVSVGMRNFMVERSIEKEVVSFWKELCAIRSKVLKSNMCYFVTFNPAAGTYSDRYKIYKNTNGTACTKDINDDPVSSAFLAKIEYGIPSPAPATGPDATGAPTAVVENEWQSDGNMMIVQSDAIGTINDGRVCLSSSRLPKIGYCIQLKAGTQNIKLFKWTGSTWLEM